MMNISEKIRKITDNLPDYALLIIALTAIYGAGIYYIYALNRASILLIVGLVVFSFWRLAKYLFLPNTKTKAENILAINENGSSGNSLSSWHKYWLQLSYCILLLLSFYLLYVSRSDRALISPWQLVGAKFFIAYALTSLNLVFLLINKKISATTKLISLSVHYFLSFSVAAIIYKIGYGFDPFIHQATMELIDKYGFVTPKPLYYLGEYSLVVIFHKLSAISIYTLNKFLVPALAAIYLPLATYRLTKINNSKASSWLVILFILTLSFSPFILSTPQNLSYLFLILTISFGLTKTKPLWSIILGLATLAIHPLTGIPALCWCIALYLFKDSERFKIRTYKYLRASLFLFSSLILPLALFISGGSDFKKISWNFYYLIQPIKNLFSTLSSAGQENYWLNLIYFFEYNYNLWLIIIIAFCLFGLYGKIKKFELKSILFINIALLLSFLISSQIIFTDLINYEQTNFASRLLVLIVIFCLPAILLKFQKLIDLILLQNKITKIFWLIIGLVILLNSLYISYPRIDKYFNSRGYSTSQNDIQAVNDIALNTKDTYIVLANQQVSVAALKELGFDHYYDSLKGPLYFYPIPTGGPLYQYYLSMVYKNPSRETMAEARSLIGVKESYLVVNKYWFQSDRVINAAKLSADSWKTINNDVYIFKYLP